MTDLSITTFAKTIKCNVTTTFVARRGSLVLFHVEFSNASMPGGYKEVYGPERDERKDHYIDTINPHGSAPGELYHTEDHSEAAQKWDKYWTYHDSYSKLVVGPQGKEDEKATRWIHAAVLIAYDNEDFA